MPPQATFLPNFSLKHVNISFPLVKLTSVVVTCLVFSLFGRPYWCKNRTASRSRRHLVDFVAIAGNANPPRFFSKIAKVRSCDLHLCSISLQMCPPSFKIDRSRSLMCPKSLSSAKNRRTSVLPKRNSCLSNATVVVKLDEYPKGFALVIVASPTDHLCQVRRMRRERHRTFVVVVVSGSR